MISKPNNKVPNVHFVIHSNEKTTPIAGLCLKYFNDFIGLDNINITVVANKFTTEDLPFYHKVNYLNAEVDFHDAGFHFGPTMSKFINNITEEYFFFFCEDYMLTKPIDVDNLNKLVNMMKAENIDMFSFASNQPIPNKLVKYEKNVQYGFQEDELYYIKKGYKHEYSVQPCIWKKSSFAEILKYNPDLGLHYLDNSHVKGKKGTYRDFEMSTGTALYVDWPEDEKYNHKTLCSKYMIFDYFPIAGQYFIITYIEMIRWGKFTLPGTPGPILADDNWVQQIIFKIIEENNLRKRPEFDRYFYKIT